MNRRPNLLVVAALTSAAAALGQPLTINHKSGAPGERLPEQILHVQAGFKIETVYVVPTGEQGSWICLTVDPKGRLVAADQYGGLYRLMVPATSHAGKVVVQRLATKLSGAHGLLHAFGSLYVMINEDRKTAGLWRLRDTDGDDEYDEEVRLREIGAIDDHGVHSLQLGPDGKSIYFIAGCTSPLPAGLEKTRPVLWGEDHLLPRLWDARGWGRGKLAPGGYVARTDPEGRTIELLGVGIRNGFDLAFDQNGELFTYDADMEWDLGTPWYVPTRILHIVDGGEYGWRSGAARWPPYYADSLPASLDVGLGSPTGVTFGTGAKFPAKYQRAFFAADWSFGTLYAIHMVPSGASFRGTREEFVAGKGLPFVDVVVNPVDGAMYALTGGKRTQSIIYRISYIGPESTAPAVAEAPTSEARLRRALESLHVDGAGREAIETAWPHLTHPDRFIRFVARVALEKQPASRWAHRAISEDQPKIEALIALARVGDRLWQPRLLEALGRVRFNRHSVEQRLSLLRAWQLTFTRMGNPGPAACERIAADLEPLFPDEDQHVNRELLSLLVFLDSPSAVPKAVPLLSVSTSNVETDEIGLQGTHERNEKYANAARNVRSSRPDRQQIAYAYALRNAKVGWTPELRLQYFSWFPRTAVWKGGLSFNGYLQNIRAEALQNIVGDPAERATLDNLSKKPADAMLTNIRPAKGPGRPYTLADASALVAGALKERNFSQGKAMFAAAACVLCHQINGEGGAVGPDLSLAGNRYTAQTFLQEIIEPSLEIRAEYANEEVERTDGSVLVGRVVAEDPTAIVMMCNPFAPEERTTIAIADVKARRQSKISFMPPGLINSLNADELKDLVAYVLSGASPHDKMFKRAE